MKDFFRKLGEVVLILLGVAIVVWVIYWAWHNPKWFG